MSATRRAVIFSASIGEGHDLPARVLAAELEAAGAQATILDCLEVLGWPVGAAIGGGSHLHSKWGSRLFDVEYWLMHFPPSRWLGRTLLYLFGSRRIMRALDALDPDVVISTYPGVTELLGQLRRRGRIEMPVVSAITDLAALGFWSHPAVDLHLVTHPESVEEVRGIAPGSEVVPVRGLNSSEFAEHRDLAEARRDLELPAEGKIVVVSGGGWAVGDLEGAVRTALDGPDSHVVALCGRNDRVRERLERLFFDEPRVSVLGFTDRMGDLLAAADALVHSTAGLTVLEAHVRGCPVISYGWGKGHIRANNRAFRRFGLAEVARGRPELAAALRRALTERRPPDGSFARLPSAASVVLERLARG